MGDIQLVTIIIIAANVLISYKGFNDPAFFDKYKFHVGAIKSGQQIRMFTSGFLHVDGTHLFVNMLTLYFFANDVIIGLGTSGFLIVYLEIYCRFIFIKTNINTPPWAQVAR